MIDGRGRRKEPRRPIGRVRRREGKREGVRGRGLRFERT